MKYITSPYLSKTRIDSNEIFNAYIFRNQHVGNAEMDVLKYWKPKGRYRHDTRYLIVRLLKI